MLKHTGLQLDSTTASTPDIMEELCSLCHLVKYLLFRTSVHVYLQYASPITNAQCKFVNLVLRFYIDGMWLCISNGKKTLFIYISAYPNKVIMIANSNYEEFNHVSILQPYI